EAYRFFYTVAALFGMKPDDPQKMAENIRSEIRRRLQELRSVAPEDLIAARWNRLRRIGCFGEGKNTF
ncbi:MAG: hypothetical protein ACPLTR_03405, partial [Thermacetogeniaceae bacterium]